MTRRHLLRWVGVALVAAGLAGTGEAAWLQGKARLAQVLLEHSWEMARRTGEPAPAPWPWADTRPVARLLVPALGVDQFILDGANGRNLAFGPVHLAPSAAPGHPGHVVLSAHRDTHFAFVKRLLPGQEIRLERADGGVRRYTVAQAEIIDQRSERLALLADQSLLTLGTCHPHAELFSGTPLRLVVHAVPADGSGLEAFDEGAGLGDGAVHFLDQGGDIALDGRELALE